MNRLNHKTLLSGFSVLLVAVIGACGLVDLSGTPDADINPNSGQGNNPKISPVNQASEGDIQVRMTTQPVVLDGTIDAEEWQDADTVWFIGGEEVRSTAYFMRDATRLLVAYHMPDESPDDREKIRFIVDVQNDGGGVDEVKSDDLQFYLQRGNGTNFNPSTFFDDHAWDVFQGAGDAWLPLNRSVAFEFSVTNEDTFWTVELAIPLEHFNYNGEESREYGAMSFVANAGNGHGAWPVDTFFMQPDTWGRLVIHGQ